MPRHPAVVENLLWPTGAAQPIGIGSPAWYAWLATHTAFIYGTPLNFTARREERPGGQYWYAYKRVDGKLRKRYLGRGEDLTFQRLAEAALSLSAPPAAIAPPLDAISLVATRFAVPRIPSEYVPRPQLLEQLSRATERACTLVAAPAGAGKTMLLALGCEQQRARGRRIAWLSLEYDEQDPVRFWQYVLAALDRAVPGVARVALASLQTLVLVGIEALLTPLINALAEQRAPVLLVLDDYHLASTTKNDAALLFLIEHAPHALRLVVSSRNEPNWPLVRLQVRGKLAVLRYDALRFSEAEAGTFLTRTMRLRLTPAQIAALEARTEGWIAGLQLAALSLANQTNIPAFITDFAGSDRYIGEYLMSEVISGQTPAVQDFLLRTAILSRMCGPLCEMLVNSEEADAPHHDAQSTLETLERANLFVVALDQERRWYRYHHLFAEMLRAQLKRHDPALLAACHERAARWLAAHNDARAAIEHALAAPVYPLAASLIADEVEPLLQRGEMTTILVWLRALPAATLAGHPRLALIGVITLLMTGEIASATMALQRLETTLPDSTASAALRGELLAVRALNELMTGGDVAFAMELAREALQQLPTAHGVVRDIAALLYGATMPLLHDDLAASLQLMTQTVETSLRHGNYLIASFALENRTLKELAQGRLRQAERTCEEARRIATLADGTELPFASWAYLRLGDMYRERNQIEQARAALEHGLAQDFLLRHPEIVIDAYIALARVYDLLGDRARVRDLLHTSARAAQTGQVTPHTAWQIEAFHARMLCGWGDVAEAARWAERYAHSAQHTERKLPMALTDACEFTRARIAIAQNAYSTAQHLLEPLLAAAQTAGRVRSVIEASLLLALVAQALKRADRALAYLADALRLAAPEGFVRLFLDEEQPMLDLLARYLATGAATEQHAATTGYARQLLTHAGQFVAPVLPDMPSPRELELLHLLAAGKSNDEIAAALFLARSTVKWHLSHLYRKLDVSRRSQAIARGRALKLID